MAVFFFVLYAMLSLAPGRNHAVNATAITTVVVALLRSHPHQKKDNP